MNPPQSHIWGPHLWMILHSSAEKIGVSKIKNLPQEEVRIWSTLLGSLRYSLPCPICKQHYSAYYLSAPITNYNKEFIRNWLYVLHNQINTRTHKQSPAVEQLPEIYGKLFNFTSHFNVLNEQMRKSLKLGWSSREDVQRTMRILQELKCFYDYF